MNAEQRPLREHVASPPLSDVERARLVRSIVAAHDSRKPAPAPRRQWVWAAATAVLVLGSVALLARRRDAAPTQAANVSPTAPPAVAETRQIVALGEGAAMELAFGTKARVDALDPASIQVTVLRGRADFATTGRPRDFLVHVASYVVRVQGVRFFVEHEPEATAAVRVGVEQGTARVERPGRSTVELGAGETWSSSPDAHAEVAAPLAPAPAEVRPRVRVRASEDPARHIFARAARSRLAGREREAVQLFERLGREHPRHDLAALSLFAAGRLRLLRLDDARGALADLERARRVGLPGPLAEDCHARIVEALGKLGDGGRCAREQAAYLARFPAGPHRGTVERACR